MASKRSLLKQKNVQNAENARGEGEDAAGPEPARDDPQTAAGIANEWELYNATLLQSIDVLMYSLITDTQYKLPQLAPDGNYCPNTNSISNITANKKLLKITDALGRETKRVNQPLFYIYDDGTVEKKIVVE